MLEAYDFRLKLDAINNRIPDEFKNKISASNIAKWRKENWNKRLLGFKYYNNQDRDLNNLTQKIQDLKRSMKELEAENELLKLINKTTSGGKEFHKLVHKNKIEIVNCVESKKRILGNRRSAEMLNISPNTLFEWRVVAKAECQFSNKLVCIKRRPNQLSMDEELKIIQLLQDPRFEHYPLTSLRWKAHYENLVHVGLYTWRKLQKVYGIIRVRAKRERKRYKSLKAEYTNQYLHADITYFKLSTGKTYYIYIVKDNYSKYIKSWVISDTINPEIRIKTFKNALKDVDLQSNKQTSFVTDSGNENISRKVKDFFKMFNNVDIKYARKDIPYSNSMIERYNHDLKYMYLYRDSINSLKVLNKKMEMAVKEHNFIKRLACLDGQTPYEFYHGIPSKKELIMAQWKEARKNRYIKTKNTICCIPDKSN